MRLHQRATATVITCGRCQHPYTAASMILTDLPTGAAIICPRCARRTSATGGRLAAQASHDLRAAIYAEADQARPDAAPQSRPRRPRLIRLPNGAYVEQGGPHHQRYIQRALAGLHPGRPRPTGL